MKENRCLRDQVEEWGITFAWRSVGVKRLHCDCHCLIITSSSSLSYARPEPVIEDHRCSNSLRIDGVAHTATVGDAYDFNAISKILLGNDQLSSLIPHFEASRSNRYGTDSEHAKLVIFRIGVIKHPFSLWKVQFCYRDLIVLPVTFSQALSNLLLTNSSTGVSPTEETANPSVAFNLLP